MSFGKQKKTKQKSQQKKQHYFNANYILFYQTLLLFLISDSALTDGLRTQHGLNNPDRKVRFICASCERKIFHRTKEQWDMHASYQVFRNTVKGTKKEEPYMLNASKTSMRTGDVTNFVNISLVSVELPWFPSQIVKICILTTNMK